MTPTAALIALSLALLGVAVFSISGRLIRAVL